MSTLYNVSCKQWPWTLHLENTSSTVWCSVLLWSIIVCHSSCTLMHCLYITGVCVGFFIVFDGNISVNFAKLWVFYSTYCMCCFSGYIKLHSSTERFTCTWRTRSRCALWLSCSLLLSELFQLLRHFIIQPSTSHSQRTISAQFLSVFK